MADFPREVTLNEEGPREGFQFEKGPIPTARKIELIDALSKTGLGGCPFAAHKGAAGNVCTEDLAFMCEEMGIRTGIDLDLLIEASRLAEDVVGHSLPGAVKSGGSLRRYRERAAAAA